MIGLELPEGLEDGAMEEKSVVVGDGEQEVVWVV